MNTLEIDGKYENITTKHGPAVLLSISETNYNIVNVLLRKRHSNVFTDRDSKAINTKDPALYLVCKGSCTKSTTGTDFVGVVVIGVVVVAVLITTDLQPTIPLSYVTHRLKHKFV
jgi:hypothetical protein